MVDPEYVKLLEERIEFLEEKTKLIDSKRIEVRVKYNTRKYFLDGFFIGEVYQITSNKFNLHYPRDRSNSTIKSYSTYTSLLECENVFERIFQCRVKT